MRGDTWLTLRLLARRQGLAGVLIALSGGLVVAGAVLPWLRAVATVAMLGSTDTAHLGHVTLLQRPAGVLVVVAGAALVVLGVAIAIDRPPAHAVRALVAVVVVAAVAALVATVPLPSVTSLSPTRIADLAAVAPDLPLDVEVTTGVRGGPGPVAVALGLVGAAIGALVAREG